MKKTLAEFNPGESGVVVRIDIKGEVRRRLFDMGITPGAELTMRKAAPLGDPIEITIRGYELSLRKNEAKFITVSLEEGGGKQ